MCIRSGERQSVSDVGLRARSKVDVVEPAAVGVITGDGDVLFDRFEMVLAEGISKVVFA